MSTLLVEPMPAPHQAEPGSMRVSSRRICLDEANEVLRQIVHQIEISPAEVQLDLSEVEEANSACIAILVRAFQVARNAGKKLTLLAISPVIRCLLKLNRLDRFAPSK